MAEAWEGPASPDEFSTEALSIPPRIICSRHQERRGPAHSGMGQQAFTVLNVTTGIGRGLGIVLSHCP